MIFTAFICPIRRSILLGLALCFAVHCNTTALRACPFCPALQPTLAQQREEAEWCLIGEALPPREAANAKTVRQAIRIHRPLKSPAQAEPPREVELQLTEPLPTGQLLVLFGTSPRGGDLPRWTNVRVNEIGLAYLARLPDLRQPPAERLAYVAPYLEHDERLIAEDAAQEFAHADLADVRAALNRFDYAKIRGWLISPEIRAEHKGFYGLLLGMSCAAAKQVTENGGAKLNPKPVSAEISTAEISLNRDLLARLAFEKQTDFRAGYDGVLAGYLLANGAEGIATIAEKLLDYPNTPTGDARHAAAALRFYHEYGPADMRPAVAAATAKLLTREECAAAAITDLARWKAWAETERIAAIASRPGIDAPTKRAAVGYLKASPQERAGELLARLRAADPAGVEGAENALRALQGKANSATK